MNERNYVVETNTTNLMNTEGGLRDFIGDSQE